MGSTPGRGTRIMHATWYSPQKVLSALSNSVEGGWGEEKLAGSVAHSRGSLPPRSETRGWSLKAAEEVDGCIDRNAWDSGGSLSVS